MIKNDRSFERFFTWLQTFDPHSLINEAEVKTEFVTPFFAHLGYPDGCRRHEYALTVYEPGKRTKNAYIDLVYFSTAETNEQTADTSLVIVEAKRPGETNLESALDQARFYGYYLAPIFLVITDAHWLRIVKRHCYRGEELLFDLPLDALHARQTAYQLYHDLQFDAVKNIKAHLADEVTHTLYIDLMHALSDHPNLRTELTTRDFHPSQTQKGRNFTVVEPKASVICKLPVAFGEGECHIRFSNLLLRGLTCHLTHRQILTELLPGLGTEPDWGTRHFLRSTENDNFEAHLGDTMVLLSAQEVKDLCHCVNTIGSAYKAAMVRAEDLLETWNYRPVALPDYRAHGFHLCSVAPWLWKLLHRFAHEHDRLKEVSSWHVFDASHTYLRVIHDYMREATCIYPKYDFDAEMVDLIYCIGDDESLAYDERMSGRSWQQAVGPHGRWTAQYTETWLLKQFIPYVIAYYEEKEELDPIGVLHWRLSASSETPLPLEQVSHPKELALSIHSIQSWLYSCRGGRRLASFPLRRYYTALTELVRRCVFPHLADGLLEYCHNQLLAIEFILQDEQTKGQQTAELAGRDELLRARGRNTLQQTAEALFSKLAEHVRRISAVDHENPRVADYLSCVFIALLEVGNIRCEQEQLNEAKEAVLPLLELSRFEKRYVL